MNKNNDEIEIDDIIQTLCRMATETGSLNCLGCGHEHNCGFHGCAVLMEAAAKLEDLNTFDRTQSYKMLGRINNLEAENKLLRGELESFGSDKEGAYCEDRTDH